MAFNFSRGSQITHRPTDRSDRYHSSVSRVVSQPDSNLSFQPPRGRDGYVHCADEETEAQVWNDLAPVTEPMSGGADRRPEKPPETPRRRWPRCWPLTEGFTARVAGALPAVPVQGGQLLVRPAELADAAARGQAGGLPAVRVAASRQSPLCVTVHVEILVWKKGEKPRSLLRHGGGDRGRGNRPIYSGRKPLESSM